MSNLNEHAVTLLASVTVDLQNGDGKSDIYTVPAGKSMIAIRVVIRNPTASLAGGTDFDFGDGANADTWKTAINLSTVTASTHYYTFTKNNTAITVFNAGDVFGVKPVTGATLDAQATAELFGYLV